MQEPADIQDRRPSGLSDEEAAAIFADQARVAREVALSDDERDAFENRPRLRGPIWVFVPQISVIVITIPVWAPFVPRYGELLIGVAALVMVGWRYMRRAFKRIFETIIKRTT